MELNYGNILNIIIESESLELSLIHISEPTRHSLI